MSRSPTHADLVARALGALPEPERVRVDDALERDPALRQRFEEIAGHLLQYESLPPAPPPPPFERLAAAMDADVDPDLDVLRLQRERPRLRPALIWAVGTAAAAVLVAALVVPLRSRDEPGPGPDLVAGAGLQVTHARDPVLTCERPAEARLGERVRLVLDQAARLRIEAPDAVRLVHGRAWFEVAPGRFEVRTEHGPVSVLGTAFEVDVRGGRLEVAVSRGRVRAGAVEVGAGERLVDGTVAPSPGPVGAWFRTPRLLLEAAGEHRPAPGRPLELRLGFVNPGHVVQHLQGPREARTPVWIRFETRDGRTLGELPVLAANVTAGLDLLRPGGSVELAPGERRDLTVRILPPPGCPPAYRCKALYRPEDQPAVLSSPLDIEVR